MQANMAGLNTSKLDDLRRKFRQNVQATGAFGIEQIRAKSATEKFTESLQRQDVTFSKALRSRKMFNNVLAEQYRIQKMLAVQWTSSGSGRMTADVIMPRGLDASLQKINESWRANAKAVLTAKRSTDEYRAAADMMRMRLGLLSEVVNSGANNMIKWGKNTQWAGRQLMVGFTVPFAAFGAMAGKIAYDVDAQLTRIAKVYDTTANTVIGKQKELDQLRGASTRNAIEVAKRYGNAITDTLEVEAELAAAGMRGQELLRSTAEIQRIATLGELDHQKAVTMSIALQRAFGLSVDETSDAMNYMNAVENATSLSLQDFAEATPRAASAMAALGVTVQEMGTLLVAMKENGVDAAQGANALRSATARLIRPTKESVEVLKGFGIDIISITEAANGNLFKSLQMIGEEFKRLGLNSLQQRQAIAELFGTYQFNRLNAALQGVADRGGQVGRAMDVASKSTESWANTAQNEVEKIRESLSGRFRIAVQTIRAELTTMGEPFLQFGTWALGMITKVIGGFNDLPKSMKVVMAGAIALFAVLGPIIMLIGLLANGIGSLIKFANFLPGLATKFRAITSEQKAQELLANATTKMWQDQAKASQMLANEINMLSQSFDRLNTAQRNQMAAAGVPLRGRATVPVGGYYQASTGAFSYLNASGNGRRVGAEYGTSTYLKHSRRASNAAYDEGLAMYTDPTRMRAAGQYWDAQKGKMMDIEASAKRTAGAWGFISKSASGLAGAAITMALITGNSDKLSGNIMSAVLAASLLGPTLGKGLTALRASSAFGEITKAFGIGRRAASVAGAGRMGGIAGGIQNMLPAMTRFLPVFLRFAGPVGLAATALTTFIKIRGEMDRMRKKQQDINTSAKAWADILGFVYTEQQAVNREHGKENGLLEDRAGKLGKQKPGLVEELQMLKERNRMEDLYNMALDEGVKARLHGASAAQAQQVVETALFAAGLKRKEIDQLDFVVNRINWDNMGAVIAQTQDAFKRQWDIAARNAAGQGRWEGFGRLLTGNMDNLNTKTKEKIKGMASEFWQTWKSLDQDQRRTYFDTFRQTITQQQDDAWNYISKEQRQRLKNYGIMNAQDYIKAAGLDGGGPSAMSGIIAGIVGDDDRNRLKMAAEAEREWARSIADANGVSDKNIKNIQTMSDLYRYLDMSVEKSSKSTMSVSAAQDAYANAMMRASMTGQVMTDKEKLRMLNHYRLAAGLSRATSLEQGFEGAVRGSSDAVDENSDKLKKNEQRTREWAAAQTEAIRSGMSTAWGQIMDSAMEQYENQTQAQMDRLDQEAEDLSDRQQKEQDRFENRWENIYDKFDKRWDNRIEREKKAEDFRQQAFEDEKRRLQQIADIENRNIDFNSALNRGDLDEAARIQNEAAAQGIADQREEANEAAKQAAEVRIAGLEKTREAERKALDKQKEREDKAMKREQERQQARIEAARETAQKISEINRKALERDLQAAQNYVPRNAAQVDSYVKRLEKIYADHGVKLDTQSKEWGDMITSAITTSVRAAQVAMEQDAKWERIGKRAADAAVSVFGMDIKGFMKWIRTGELPQGADKKALDAAAASPARRGALNKVAQMENRHEGGIIGIGGGSRRGYAGGQMPGETTINALRGESVLNRRATRMLGRQGVDALNDGKGGIGGMEGQFATIIGMGIGRALSNVVDNQIQSATVAKLQRQAQAIMGPNFAAAAAGKYGDVTLDTEQLSNAARIMNVGRQMGASQRDLQIALMTSLQESSLRNLSGGDRDSAGLFQQRPSQGWGSLAQVTNPEYASRQFFKHLLAIKSRGNMSLTQAAQAVQRSAYPDAYAKWENEAAAILQGSQLTMQASGKWGRPTSPVRVNRSFAAHGGEGMDLGGTPGQGIFSIGPGRVMLSTALFGTNRYDDDGYRSYGEYVIVDHGGLTSLYAHMLPKSRMVRTGDMVQQGQRLGSLGSTGNSSGPHLHFETRMNGRMVDPAGIGIPGLKIGANIKYDNTIANLHKGEKVLTAPLSAKLDRGIDNMANGRYNGDTYKFDFNGAHFHGEMDVEKAIEKVLRKRDSKMGRGRRVD